MSLKIQIHIGNWQTKTILLLFIACCFTIESYSQTIAGGNDDFESDFAGWTLRRDWWNTSTDITINTAHVHKNSKAVKCKGHTSVYNQLYANITGLVVSESYTISFYVKRKAGSGEVDFWVGPLSDIYTGTYGYFVATTSYSQKSLSFIATSPTMRIWFDFYPNTIVFVDDITITSPLPVDLINFELNTIEGLVEIKWSTSTEINNHFFSIEKSINNSDWETVAVVYGKGNSSTISDYKVLDNAPYSELSYYRIKQTDFDGKYKYSPVKTTSVNRKSFIKIYPNPARNLLTIKGNRYELEHIKMYNVLGKDITEYTKVTSKNERYTTIDISNLNPGIYNIKTKTTAHKILKKD